MSDSIITRYQNVKNRVHQACLDANRDPESVQLLAVSKTKPIEDIQILSKNGQKSFGENYVQESLAKIEICPDLEWHFIGPIQSNKTKPIAENFQWVHSVDRLKIAQRLSLQRPTDLPPLNILLEVNISEQASKAGFSPQEVLEFAPQIAALPNLNLRGLMAIPQQADVLEEQRKPFAKMHQLLKQLQQQYPDWHLDTLSMGMSGDLEAAIYEGATMVRIGTDIFGARDYSKT
ncbi:YggS family pyridoxal phosphate-dependent enzyme [Thiomicrorhabdus lithotrophica]|uniref:Pyridoxal phosphate homeostasis protein n=1 Tax=Thiomicrorhabdus lithotrophica TaxID=2949997 RepID=A0ABY8C8T0_9GAMM|nr:YggS family pyridoxal phosphate-dependent enzyme [Thiomicrorhabdus lithotrophica]WEJ62329.1 YggS family pyridoxal phosphate-dependent enzyme [Thiomicrorhabdus lithotrophica]